MSDSSDQAVLVYLDGVGLPDEVYEKYDLEGLETQLVAAVEQAGVGLYDGNEFGPEEVILFLYGSDAEAIFRVIEPVLRGYPLSAGARVEIRPGGPDAVAREIQLPRQ